jgi:hypothetical protein
MGRVFCCKRCYEEVSSLYPELETIWIDLCSLQHQSAGSFGLAVTDFHELSVLEQSGYVITTETDRYLIVKTLGEHVDNDGEIVFCINRADHEGEENDYDDD